MTNGLTVDYGENNTISVLNAATCNAQNTSGCGQMPAAVVTTNGFLGKERRYRRLSSSDSRLGHAHTLHP